MVIMLFCIQAYTKSAQASLAQSVADLGEKAQDLELALKYTLS